MDQAIWAFLKKLYRIAAQSFSVVGALYSFSEMLRQLAPGSALAFPFTWRFALGLFLASLAVFTAWTVYLHFFQTIRIPNTDRTVCIRFGDILRRRKGRIVVGVNDTLSYSASQIGSKSIHNQLIRKFGIAWVQRVFERQKQADPRARYPYGYCFSANAPDGRLFLFTVMSELTADGVPTTQLAGIRQVIHTLFGSDSFRCENNRLYMPLLGTGSAALQFSKQQLAEQIAFEFIRSQNGVCSAVHELVIVFRWRDYAKVSLEALKAGVRQIAARCADCPALPDSRRSAG